MAATQRQPQGNAPEPEAPQANRILVALDASPQSEAALRAAAELAALLEAELEGLFVEDINLLHLCGLPFGREIGSYTASVRRLDDRAMERYLRVLAVGIRQAMEREAAQRPVRWTFQVRRGAVVAELLAAAQSASMLSMGRAGQARRSALGSTAQSLVRQSSRPLLILGENGGLKHPLSVLYTGSEAADRALRLALHLEQRNSGGLTVWVWAEESASPLDTLHARAEALVAQAGLHDTASVIAGRGLEELLDNTDTGTLVLPGERAYLLSRWSGPTLLVP